MFDSNAFDEIAQKLSSSLPRGLQSAKHDIEHNFKQILQSGFAKLDLVTREEFDAQTKVLQRTREKVEVLEQELTKIEQQLNVTK